jgi:CheY-like chemotaxis protein
LSVVKRWLENWFHGRELYLHLRVNRGCYGLFAASGGKYMSISQSVSVYLPSLRRYARALTGSQESGDAYVAATIETLIKQPELLDNVSAFKPELFRVFSKIWNSVAVNAGAEPANAMPADRRLGQIAALPRQAFLLVSLESFSEADAAHVLDIDVTELRRLIDKCGQELAEQIATNILIIEDEAMIAFDLQSLVESLGHKVQGVARTRSEALELARKQQPGLVLADIQLADGSSGLDAVNDMLASFDVPVIFITAYPERFLTGTRPEPAFLISKPYQTGMVSAIVSQALFFEKKASSKIRRAVG